MQTNIIQGRDMIMVEYTRTKSPREITAFGYYNMGIYLGDTKEFTNILVEATVGGNIDIVILELSPEEMIYQVFSKSK